MRTLTLFINTSEYSLTMKDKIDNVLKPKSIGVRNGPYQIQVKTIGMNPIYLKSDINEKQ
ncbi:hypothetical protein [Vibrio sp. MEBiC08052]|uniref:hypothetical protein n=1 Tax=Vibrio sp. MEBiC08052 TaxID=1761910 RepID=UPI0012F814AC|nr:hypothetical protein [Vibrio sp. MEBiC08052]